MRQVEGLLFFLDCRRVHFDFATLLVPAHSMGCQVLVPAHDTARLATKRVHLADPSSGSTTCRSIFSS